MGGILLFGFVYMMAAIAAGVWLSAAERKRRTVLAITAACALVTLGQWGVFLEEQPTVLLLGNIIDLAPWTLITLWGLVISIRRFLQDGTSGG